MTVASHVALPPWKRGGVAGGTGCDVGFRAVLSEVSCAVTCGVSAHTGPCLVLRRPGSEAHRPALPPRKLGCRDSVTCRHGGYLTSWPAHGCVANARDPGIATGGIPFPSWDQAPVTTQPQAPARKPGSPHSNPGPWAGPVTTAVAAPLSHERVWKYHPIFPEECLWHHQLKGETPKCPLLSLATLPPPAAGCGGRPTDAVGSVGFPVNP